MLRHLGSIAALAGGIEFWAERAVWRLEGEEPHGKLPSTDGKPISKLIERIAKSSLNERDEALRSFITTWCDVASTAFQCRNRLLHGLAVSSGPGSEAGFMINLAWSQERRRRPAATFHANIHTLAMLEETMAVLWRGSALLASGDPKQTELASISRGLQRVRSFVNEIIDLAAAINHEKY